MKKINLQNFQIQGLPFAAFQPYFEMTAEQLENHGAMMVVADDDTAPCRVSLAHAAVGEELLLVSYQHQPAHSPYRATGPIYVRKIAVEASLAPNAIPEQIRCRLLSVRGYDIDDLIVEAEVAEGAVIETIIERFFDNAQVTYIHLHFARRGCYAARVDRA